MQGIENTTTFPTANLAVSLFQLLFGQAESTLALVAGCFHYFAEMCALIHSSWSDSFTTDTYPVFTALRRFKPEVGLVGQLYILELRFEYS